MRADALTADEPLVRCDKVDFDGGDAGFLAEDVTGVLHQHGDNLFGGLRGFGYGYFYIQVRHVMLRVSVIVYFCCGSS